MIRLALLFCCFIFCCSCVPSLIDERIFFVSDELKPAYDKFIDEGRKRGLDYEGFDIYMTFGDAPGRLGFHNVRFDQLREIVIDETEWYRTNYSSKATPNYIKWKNEATVMHELGHALLGLKHDDDCESIMSTANTCKYDTYEADQELMFNKLFGVVL